TGRKNTPRSSRDRVQVGSKKTILGDPFQEAPCLRAGLHRQGTTPHADWFTPSKLESLAPGCQDFARDFTYITRINSADIPRRRRRRSEMCRNIRTLFNFEPP